MTALGLFIIETPLVKSEADWTRGIMPKKTPLHRVINLKWRAALKLGGLHKFSKCLKYLPLCFEAIDYRLRQVHKCRVKMVHLAKEDGPARLLIITFSKLLISCNRKGARVLPFGSAFWHCL